MYLPTFFTHRSPIIITTEDTENNVIGLAQNGFLTLKQHVFFKGVPWGELLELEAPCKPSYEGEDDGEFSRELAAYEAGGCDH